MKIFQYRTPNPQSVVPLSFTELKKIFRILCGRRVGVAVGVGFISLSAWSPLYAALWWSASSNQRIQRPDEYSSTYLQTPCRPIYANDKHARLPSSVEWRKADKHLRGAAQVSGARMVRRYVCRHCSADAEARLLVFCRGFTSRHQWQRLFMAVALFLISQW